MDKTTNWQPLRKFIFGVSVYMQLKEYLANQKNLEKLWKHCHNSGIAAATRLHHKWSFGWFLLHFDRSATSRESKNMKVMDEIRNSLTFKPIEKWILIMRSINIFSFLPCVFLFLFRLKVKNFLILAITSLCLASRNSRPVNLG